MGSRNAAVTESEFPTSILLHILTKFYLQNVSTWDSFGLQSATIIMIATFV